MICGGKNNIPVLSGKYVKRIDLPRTLINRMHIWIEWWERKKSHKTQDQTGRICVRFSLAALDQFHGIKMEAGPIIGSNYANILDDLMTSTFNMVAMRAAVPVDCKSDR